MESLSALVPGNVVAAARVDSGTKLKAKVGAPARQVIRLDANGPDGRPRTGGRENPAPQYGTEWRSEF